MSNFRSGLKQIIMMICLLITVGILCMQSSIRVSAAESGRPSAAESQTGEDSGGNSLTLTLDDGGNGQLNGTLLIFITLTLLSLAPTILIMMTSFTRIIIVLHFTRAALNTQTALPNQVLIGMALILTFFIMEPTITRINEEAIQPFEAGELTQEEAFEAGVAPLRNFMYDQTQVKDVELFMDIAGQTWDGSDLDAIPLSVLLPSFMLSEMRLAFWIGFMIYIPFIVIDMVVASTLMSMGMMMLPPTTISMPFKILLFVLADGWTLVIGNLMDTFLVTMGR